VPSLLRAGGRPACQCVSTMISPARCLAALSSWGKAAALPEIELSTYEAVVERHIDGLVRFAFGKMVSY
jgi:hypothetical protein